VNDQPDKHSKHHAEPSGLIARGLDYGGIAEFIYTTISALAFLDDEQVGRQYARSNPEAASAIRELTRAVCACGHRVQDMNPNRNILDEPLRLFTDEEIWLCDLAADVVAMLATSGGLHGFRGQTIFDKLRDLDKLAHTHHWKSMVRKADPGPAQFRQLRELIPHHKASR